MNDIGIKEEYVQFREYWPLTHPQCFVKLQENSETLVLQNNLLSKGNNLRGNSKDCKVTQFPLVGIALSRAYYMSWLRKHSRIGNYLCSLLYYIVFQTNPSVLHCLNKANMLLVLVNLKVTRLEVVQWESIPHSMLKSLGLSPCTVWQGKYYVN